MSGFLRFVVWVAVVLGALGAFLYFAFFDVWRIPSDDPQLSVSVAPTLAAGDYVLVARHGTPGTGNLVRCKDPDEPRRWVIGRWAANGGDRVELAGEGLAINGRVASSPGGCTPPSVTLVNPTSGAEEKLTCREVEFAGATHETLVATSHAESNKALTVDPGRIFLVSDNRHMHLDSRDFGGIESGSCEHLVFRLWGDTGYFDAAHRFTILW
jgi:signal peptidase I